MLFPAKQRICPSAHLDLCLATIPPDGRSGGCDGSIWEERIPLGRSWRARPPTSPCCSEKPSMPQAGVRRAGQGRRTRERGARGRRQRPGLPGADGDGERPVPLAQRLPLALHGGVAAEPAGPPRLARLPLPGQPGQGQMGPHRKGGAPYPDGRRDFTQLGVGSASPVI